MSGVPLLRFTGHSDFLWNAVWDPSGRYLATAGDDTHVMVWDVGSALQKPSNGLQTLSQPLYSWKIDNKLTDNHLHWTSDGRHLVASANDSNAFYVLDVFPPNSQPQKYTDVGQTNPFIQPVYDFIACRPGQNQVAVNDYYILPNSATVGLWEIGNMRGPVRTYTTHLVGGDLVGHIGWSKDGTMLAISSAGGQEVVILDAQTGNKLNNLTVPDRTQGKNIPFIIRVQLVWSPIDRNVLATFDLDAIVVYNPHNALHPLMLGTDDISAHTPPHGHGYILNVNWFPEVNGIDWSPNGRYIVGSYISSPKLHIWDLQDPHPQTSQDGLQLQKLIFPSTIGSGHSDTVTDTSWSPDGRYIASASFDTTAIVWKVDAG
jgi:WD40 repeat protein